MVNRHEVEAHGCSASPQGGVYRIHSEPKSGSSWFSRVFVSLLQTSCLHMKPMGCRILHHEEDARQEPEIVLRYGTFYRTYLTLTPNYKHAGECMHFVSRTWSTEPVGLKLSPPSHDALIAATHCRLFASLTHPLHARIRVCARARCVMRRRTRTPRSCISGCELASCHEHPTPPRSPSTRTAAFRTA